MSLQLYNQLSVILLLCVWLTYFSCHARLEEIDNNDNKNIECVESERDALLEFKRGIHVDRCGLLDSWNVTRDCCKWYGIQCHNHSGHVIALRIPTHDDYAYMNSCLNGTISSSLLDLKHLKYLDLGYNYFPQKLPKFIGSLSNLEHLNLSNVGFKGAIPHEIGNLSRLTSLDLNSYFYYDYMRVENLFWLSRLTWLREVDLGGIDLSVATNSWLSIVNNLPFLHVLRLGDCNLSLKLPPSLSYINSSTTLSILDLSYNYLTDTSIFEWLTNLDGVKASLVHLDLSHNQQLFKFCDFQQTGYIMNFLGNLCSLQTLQLIDTSLKYQFSDIIQSLSVCSHESLVDLNLSNNQVSGSIPDNIINLSYLRKLKVDDNMLSGTISQAVLGGLPMLETLYLSSNSLKGVINSAHLSNLSKLSVLSLADNTELVVNIDSNWIPPFQLDELHLRSCKVGPGFPIWLITQKHFTFIGLSDTGISGTMPVSFFSSLTSKLELLSMARNMMYGVLPDVSITFEHPPWIDLSSNNFSGAIPSFFKNVRVLILNNNHLSQGLVPFLCPQTKMPLIYLDLSNNSFSDKFPDCWGYFDNLKVLLLENNKLWGNIPDSVGVLNQLNNLHLSNNNRHVKTIDLSNNILDGQIPEGISSLIGLKQMNLTRNHLSGSITTRIVLRLLEGEDRIRELLLIVVISDSIHESLYNKDY